MRWLAVVAVCLLVGSARADDWDVRRDPFDAAVVRRYKQLLAGDPHHPSAHRQLVALYKRYRSVAKLEAEYRVALERGDDWGALVVIARLPRSSRVETVALWKRALAANPDDARGWLALGDTVASDAAAARDAYRRAATLATEPQLRRNILTKLVHVAGTLGDTRTVDESYVALIALAPGDGALWLARGGAQLRAKHYEAARESFAAAEPLLRTDPERMLVAMTSQATALAALGKGADAVAQYERTLAKVPRGHYMAREVVLAIVETQRRRARLRDAIAWLEQRWPERARGHFEWDLLGDLHQEAHDELRALAAYRRAVGKAPTEVTTQRKLIALLDKHAPDEALLQHERAARRAPGDPTLQLELARRYFPKQREQAFATTAALSRRMRDHASVRKSIAELYESWEEPARALVEYEAVARLEPHDPDHAIVLGEAYWRAEKAWKAIEAWERLDAIGTREALFRHGEILAMHELWDEAAAAYTKSLARDPANADALYGRARSYDQLERYAEALADARRAAALVAHATHERGLRNRQLLVRVHQHASDKGERAALAKTLGTWRFAFERGDNAAGYLLAAHHARLSSPQQHAILVELYRRIPEDDSLGIAVARSHLRKHDFDRARSELERIATRTPSRATEIASLIEYIEDERERHELAVRWEHEGRHATHARSGHPDLVGRERVGLRIMLGADIAGTQSALLGLGVYRAMHVARGTGFAVRLDWAQRDDEVEETSAFAFGAAISRRLVDARRFELAAGGGGSFELRYGLDHEDRTWGRVGLAVDATLELLPRSLPAALGLRFQQALTDPGKSSALLVELGFEVR